MEKISLLNGDYWYTLKGRLYKAGPSVTLEDLKGMLVEYEYIEFDEIFNMTNGAITLSGIGTIRPQYPRIETLYRESEKQTQGSFTITLTKIGIRIPIMKPGHIHIVTRIHYYQAVDKTDLAFVVNGELQREKHELH